MQITFDCLKTRKGKLWWEARICWWWATRAFEYHDKHTEPLITLIEPPNSMKWACVLDEHVCGCVSARGWNLLGMPVPVASLSIHCVAYLHLTQLFIHSPNKKMKRERKKSGAPFALPWNYSRYRLANLNYIHLSIKHHMERKYFTKRCCWY